MARGAPGNAGAAVRMPTQFLTTKILAAAVARTAELAGGWQQL